MKVLHVITRMNTGGPAVFLDHLTKKLEDLNCHNIIAYGYCEGNESDYTSNHKFISELIKIKSLHRSLQPIDDIRAFFQLRNVIKQVKPDLIQTHTSKAGVLGRLAAKSVSKKLPVVHTFHGHLIYGYFAKYKSVVFTVIEKLMALFTDAAVAVTNETKKSLISLGIGSKLKWRVIQIGVPVKSKSTKQLSSSEGLKLLWVGRFTDIKDPFYAIEVIKSLANSNIKLTMVGEGELFEKAKLAAKDAPINFTGWLLNPFENIEEFDLLMLTSKNEGLPLVILEAANCSRATITRNVGGVGEFVKNNQSGYLIDSGPEKMAEKLISIAKNKSELITAGEFAYKLLTEEFSVEKMADKYLSLYSELIVRN